MSVKPIPDGYHSVTPYLIIKNAAKAIEFYQRAFGAEELLRLATPDGTVMHAEIQIEDSRIMLADEFPDMGIVGPETLGGAAVSLCVYVTDVDQRFETALAAGGEEVRPVVDQFYGDRAGTLKDPFGHMWTIATHTEELSEEELQQRFRDYAAEQE